MQIKVKKMQSENLQRVEAATARAKGLKCVRIKNVICFSMPCCFTVLK